MSTDIITTNEISQPGLLLKAEREKRGQTTKQIAAILNLPERFIIYLEEGEFNKLPGFTFARGYIRNYAKYFELHNIEELVGLFDNYVGNEVSETKVLDFKQIKHMKNISNSIYWLISFIICLVLAGIGFLIWQHYASANSNFNALLTPDNKQISVEPTVITATNTEIATNLPLIESASVSIPLTTNDTTVQENYNLPLSENNNLPLPTVQDDSIKPTVESADTTIQSPPERPQSQTTKEGEGTIEASFKSDCWVSITDATGKVLISKLFVANTTLNITGKAPIEVVLGAPNAVTLRYNGNPVKIDSTSNSTHRIKLGK